MPAPQAGYAGSNPVRTTQCPHRLAAKVTVPSRRGHRFKSGWGSQAGSVMLAVRRGVEQLGSSLGS
jgi:hypothetical protein